MLRQLLQLIEAAEGPVSLTDLSRQLDVAPATLDGMLQHWVRKGRLVVSDRSVKACAGGCGSCSGAVDCPFIVRLPVAYRLSSIVRVDADAP